MIRRRQLILFISMILSLCITPGSDAAYFVFNQNGNIRAGPSTKYRIIGLLSKGTITQIPLSFKDYDAKWVPIDAKIEYDKKTKAEKVVYTKWVNRSLGNVVKGNVEDVEKYLAVRESGWPKKLQELVLAGEEEIGMTTHMVYYSWGKPDGINESASSDGIKEEWIYKRQGSKTQYLYFKDGLLTVMK